MILALAIALGVAEPGAAADVELWRLDCGTLDVADFGQFSDTGAFQGERRLLTDSCYLIRHGKDYLLWDTGLDSGLKGAPKSENGFTQSLNATIPETLARIGVKPEQIGYVGISHYHFDHIGQAALFPHAKLLIGAEDFAAFKPDGANAPARDPAPLKPWVLDGAPAEQVKGDKDIFGDGSVVMLGMPGHTPGHHALLVRLARTGPVLLSGDQFHSQPSFDTDQVPSFNTNRADTLASSDRFKRLARTMGARIVIQHEPRDVAKLPAFPESAK